MAKKDKIKIPKSVLDLRHSPKKFAKKHNIRINGKGLSKGEKKRNKKRLKEEYSEHAIEGLNKAVKILAEHPDHKKTEKVKAGVDNIINNDVVMKRIVKLYKKDPSSYPNMIYLPNMIMNTLAYYNSDTITDEEKAIGAELDTEGLIKFCEKILKKEIKRYENAGIAPEVSFQLAVTIPTTKLFKNRKWYKHLISTLYDIAEKSDVDVDAVLRAVTKVDKKKGIKKQEFLEGFFSEFILQKNTNRIAKFNDSQKQLHEDLIERSLVYLDNLKKSKLRDVLKQYIKRRKNAEEYKNDSKRVIKFTEHANSNSPYANIKTVVQDLIADNASNELYLS